ncbi:MAG: TonB-dependent receptor [Gammaproteobacteria bacterium]|nr:TonB-dependent receptor [Gammaproteobacteria bacterium]
MSNQLVGAGLALASLTAFPVLSAQAQQTPAATEDTVISEILVTAQKRTQNLQEVPIAISVVGGEQLERAGGFNVEALRQLVPTLNIRKTNTQINQALFLRGVGTINFAIAAQPSVAAVLDGVVLTSAGEAFGDLYDVERVEVLRGPQGTLFGKNSSAGVVNIISKRPGSQFGGYVDAGWYEDNELKVKAALDAPLSEALRTRTTVFWGDFDGYIDNVSTTAAGGKLNGYEHKGIRTLWVADASDSLQLTFSADYRDADDNCCVEVIGNRPTGGQAAALTALLVGTDFAGDESRKVRQNLQMRSEEEAYGASLQADWDLGAVTLTSISAWRTWESVEIREGDWLDAGAAYVGINQLHDFGPQETDTFSQEIRIASAPGGRVDYVAGLFYSQTDAERFFQRNTIVCSASTLPVDATGLRPCTAAASTIVTPSASASFGADFENYAAFADGTFNLSDELRLIAGARWTQDELSYFHNYNPSPIPGPGLRTVTSGFTGSDSSDNISGRAGFQWDVTDNLMTYATYARGYKGPAFNVFFNMSPNDRNVIDAETADSYEVGVKSTLFGGSLIFNAAAFWAEYENFQANNFLILNNVLITTLTNAGNVTSGGAELDFIARPTDAFSLSGGLAYTDARIDEIFTPAGQTPRFIIGSSLPLAPKWKATLQADYRISFNSFDLVPAATVSYQDEQWADLNENALTRIPAYTTVDLSLALQDANDRYRIALVGRNVTDESFAAMITTGGPGGAPRLQIPREADRYFGIQTRFNFGGH